MFPGSFDPNTRTTALRGSDGWVDYDGEGMTPSGYSVSPSHHEGNQLTISTDNLPSHTLDDASDHGPMEFWPENTYASQDLSQNETRPTEPMEGNSFHYLDSRSLRAELSLDLDVPENIEEFNVSGLELEPLFGLDSSYFPSHREESHSALFAFDGIRISDDQVSDDHLTISIREPSPAPEGDDWAYNPNMHGPASFKGYCHDLVTDRSRAAPSGENSGYNLWRSPQIDSPLSPPDQFFPDDSSGSSYSGGYSPDTFSSSSLQGQSPLHLNFDLTLSPSITRDSGCRNFDGRTHNRSVSLSPGSPGRQSRGRSLSRGRGRYVPSTQFYQESSRSRSAHELSATGYTPDISEYASDSQTLVSDGASSSQPPIQRDIITSPATRKRALKARTNPKKHAQFKCDYKKCDSTFTTKQNRDRHINAHLGRNRFQCSCTGSFTTASDRNRHMKTTMTRWEEQGKPGRYRCGKVDKVKG